MPFVAGNDHSVKGGEALLAKYGRSYYAAIGRKGGKVSRSRKLTDEDVRSIRFHVANGISQTELAEDFGVSRDTVSAIVRRVTYQDVTE